MNQQQHQGRLKSGHLFLATCLLLAGLLFPQDVKLLAGFEYDEMQTWGWNGTTVADWINSGSGSLGTLFQGDATEGEWAVGRGFSSDAVSWYLTSPLVPENNILYTQGRVFQTYGFLESWMGSDWSGYDRMRMDIKSTTDSCVVWLSLQDELTSPFLIRRYVVPGNQWVTLEFNLADAAKEIQVPLSGEGAAYWGVDTLKGRVLNLSEMANLSVNVTHFYHVQAQHVVVDNLRLLKAGAEDGGTWPLLRDTTAFQTVQELPPQSPVWTNRYTGARNTAPLTLGEPSFIDLGAGDPGYAYLTGMPYAISAVDNDRIAIGSWIYGGVRKTLNGGQDWTSVPGFFHSYQAPGSIIASSGDDLMGFYTSKCGGGGVSTAMYFRRLQFNGTDWKFTTRKLITPNSWHCPEWKVNGIRLPNGRIWMLSAHTTRYRGIWMRGWYSDDEGETWRWPNASGLTDAEAWRTYGTEHGNLTGAELWVDNSGEWEYEGKTASLGTITTSLQYSAFFPMLVRYGDEVACFWLDGNNNTIKWSHSDGKRWTPPTTLLSSMTSRPSGAVYHEATGDIYFANGQKIYRFDGMNAPVDITPALCTGGILSLSGNLLMNVWKEQSGGQYLIRYCTQELPNGTWSEAHTLATEDVSFNLTSTQSAPENFFPVAWAFTGSTTKWLKFQRIPIAGTSANKQRVNVRSAPFLEVSPNPFCGQMVFKYQVPKAGAVSFKVYDRCGRLVQSLLETKQALGVHQVKWDARHLAAGLYVARIKADGLNLSRKLIIVK
ncbi:MAG: T9SS type A sorting domain-containing protein [Fibrobacterota bacterium]